MSGKIKKMNLTEFLEQGFLQEANRQFFHPLGLALEMKVDDDGNVKGFSRVQDYRDDPEGMIFGTVDRDKAEHVAALRESKKNARILLMGDVVQPVDETADVVHEFLFSPAPTITKREYFAALAMQGILASSTLQDAPIGFVVVRSVELADALLAELEVPYG